MVHKSTKGWSDTWIYIQRYYTIVMIFKILDHGNVISVMFFLFKYDSNFKRYPTLYRLDMAKYDCVPCEHKMILEIPEYYYSIRVYDTKMLLLTQVSRSAKIAYISWTYVRKKQTLFQWPSKWSLELPEKENTSNIY